MALKGLLCLWLLFHLYARNLFVMIAPKRVSRCDDDGIILCDDNGQGYAVGEKMIIRLGVISVSTDRMAIVNNPYLDNVGCAERCTSLHPNEITLISYSRKR